MERQIVKVKDGLVQITTVDERWYVAKDFEPGDDIEYTKDFYPSASWIANYYPKGVGYWKWLASKGWDEAERIKEEAGEYGSKVHQAIEALLKGETLNLSSKFFNKNSGEDEALTPKEYEALLTFCKWHKKFKPKVLSVEKSFINTEYGYGGTIDLVWILEKDVKDGRKKFRKGLYVTDHKTSSNIWKSHEIQASLYKRGLPYLEETMKKIKEEGYEWQDANISILRVGYSRTNKGYKLDVLDDKFDLALAARRIWQEENEEKDPKQVEYPEKLKL